jgi:hypothetical protein
MWPHPLAEVDELAGRCLDGVSQNGKLCLEDLLHRLAAATGL